MLTTMLGTKNLLKHCGHWTVFIACATKDSLPAKQGVGVGNFEKLTDQEKTIPIYRRPLRHKQQPIRTYMFASHPYCPCASFLHYRSCRSTIMHKLSCKIRILYVSCTSSRARRKPCTKFASVQSSECPAQSSDLNFA